MSIDYMIICLPQLECRLQKGSAFCLFFLLMYYQILKQYLAHSKHSIKFVEWLDE